MGLGFDSVRRCLFRLGCKSVQDPVRVRFENSLGNLAVGSFTRPQVALGAGFRSLSGRPQRLALSVADGREILQSRS